MSSGSGRMLLFRRLTVYSLRQLPHIVLQHRSPSNRFDANTAKVSSIIVPRTLSFATNTNGARLRRPSDMHSGTKAKGSRRRRSSSLLYQEPPESLEHMSDQSALPNLNANWVNAKGE